MLKVSDWGGSNVRRLSSSVVRQQLLVNTLEVTILAQSSRSFVSMTVLMQGRMELKLGQVRSKTRSIGQNMKKAC